MKRLLLFVWLFGMTAVCMSLAKDEPKHGGKTLPDWLVTLQSKDPSLRWQAVEALGEIGKQKPRAVVGPLTAAIKDADPNVRFQAVISLTQLGRQAEAANAALEGVLDDKDSDLRRQAAIALAGIGPHAQETSTTLGKTLEDANLNVRLAAIKALRDIGPSAGPESSSALVKALTDVVPLVRREAAITLGRIAKEQPPQQLEIVVKALVKSLEDNDLQVRRLAAASVGEFGPQAESAVEALGIAARGKDADVARVAAQALARIGSKALPELLRNLTDRVAQVRLHAAEGLSIMRSAAHPAIDALLKAVQDPDPNVVRVSLQALQTLNPDPAKALPVIQKVLEHPNRDVRFWAAILVGEIALGSENEQSARGVTALQVTLNDRDKEIQRQTIHWLGELGPRAKDAVKPLLILLNEADPELSQQVAMTLLKIEPKTARQAIPKLLQNLTAGKTSRAPYGFAAEPAEALAAIGDVDALVEAAQGEDESIRSGATEALRLMGRKAKSAFPALSIGLQHKNPAVRQRAMEALLAIQPDYKDALPVALKFLKSDDVNLRYWAVRFLSTLGTQASEQEPLLRTLIERDPNPAVRVQAVWAFRGLLLAHPLGKDPADKLRRETLLTALKDSDMQVRHAAASLVLACAANQPRAASSLEFTVPLLLEGLKDSGSPTAFNHEAATALGYFPAQLRVKEMLKSEDSRVRTGVLFALQTIGTEGRDQLPVVLEALKDPECTVREQAALTVEAMGRFAVSAVPALIATLKDADPIVRPAVLRALTAIGPAAEEAAPAVVELLSAPAPALRTQVVTTLAAIGPVAIPQLLTALKHKDAKVVIMAAGSLRRMGHKAKNAVPALTTAFTQAPPQARSEIAAALTVLKAKIAPALVMALSNPDSKVRVQALKLLTELRPTDPEVIQSLAAALKSPYVGEIPGHGAVFLALREIGSPAQVALPALLEAMALPATSREAALTLRMIVAPKADVEELAKILKEKFALNDRQIVRIVATMPGKESEAFLARAFTHRNSWIRATAATGLEGRPSAGKTLANWPLDPHFEVRFAALNATPDGTPGLQDYDERVRLRAALLALDHVIAKGLVNSPAVSIMVNSVQKNAPLYRQEVDDALVQLGRLAIPAELLTTLTSDDPLVRERVARLLGRMKADAAVPELTKTLIDKSPAVRHAAVEALGQIGPKAKTVVDGLQISLKDRDQNIRDAAAIALWRVDEGQFKVVLPSFFQKLQQEYFGSPELIGYLRSEGTRADKSLLVSPMVRLVRDMGAKAEPDLLNALKHENVNLRTAAVVILGSAKQISPEVVDALSLAANDKDAIVRMQAVIALQQPDIRKTVRGEEQAVAAFTRGLRDLDSRVRSHAAAGLVVTGKAVDGVMPILMEMLLSPRESEEVRVNAIRALVVQGSQKEMPEVLRQSVKDRSAKVRQQAIQSLGQIGKGAVPVLVVTLQDKDADIRLQTVQALGQMGADARDAVASLEAAMTDRDEDVRAAAKAAVQKING